MRDCNKVLDCLHELNRMCSHMPDDCKVCPLHKIGCDALYLRQEHIDIIQKWSDEHPEKTWFEWFKEEYPNVSLNTYTGYPSNPLDYSILCPRAFIDGKCNNTTRKASNGCRKCWEEPKDASN